MKTFDQFLTESIDAIDLAKNTQIRSKDKPTTSFSDGVPRDQIEHIIAYFQWTDIKDDRLVTPLTDADIHWFKEQNYPTKNVFRYYTDKGTNVFMLDLVKGKVKWFDNEAYENTDKITFEKRFYKYKLLIIDNTPKAWTAFNLK